MKAKNQSISIPGLELGTICELTIDKLGYGGMGIARYQSGVGSGVVCLVAKTLPGEKVSARIVQLKKRHIVFETVKILTPSPLRREPACDKFSECGGCQLQHLSYEDQLRVKWETLKEQFDRSDLQFKPTLLQVNPAEPNLHYRNKNFFHSENGQLGFINPLQRKLVSLDNCPCAPESTNKILGVVLHWLNEEGAPLKAELLDCLVRDSQISGDSMVILVIDQEAEVDLHHPAWAALNQRLENSSIFLNFKPREAKYAFGESFVHLAGKPHITEKIGDFKLQLSPSSFVQIHPTQAKHLYQCVVDGLNLDGSETVLDLFSGSGTLSMFLSKKAKSVYSVELNHQAVQDAESSLPLNQINNIAFRTGKCERIVDKLLKQGQRYSVATMNPPRTGCHPDLLPQLKKIGIRRLAYISCSPPTLLRDLKQLVELGYRVEKIAPFDMFPQTYHLEVAVFLQA
jgi:23S rRNA (uracil1939-C5)-methyltransferase